MQVKRFGWVNRPTSWQFNQAWRAQRASMVARFQDDANTAGSAFASAQNNLYTGLSTLAAQASITRAQNEINAVRNQFSAATNSINLLA
jgi:hypothetical protein